MEKHSIMIIIFISVNINICLNIRSIPMSAKLKNFPFTPKGDVEVHKSVMFYCAYWHYAFCN